MRRIEDGGHSIDIRYTVIITMTPEVKKIFAFQLDQKTVPFGFSSTFDTPFPNPPPARDFCLSLKSMRGHAHYAQPQDRGRG